MSIGRRGDKTYTGFNGVPTDRLRAIAKLAGSAAGTDGRHAAPSHEAMRTYLAAGICPFCGRDEFQNLGCHTNRMHGVSADEVREMAGMLKGTPICSPSFSEIRRATMAGKRLPDTAYANAALAKHTYSEAGRLSQGQRGTPEQRQASRAKASRASGDKQLQQNAEKHVAIVATFQQGMLIKHIAQQVGVSIPTVLRTLKREGIWIDGRARRWSL